ncbi:PfkB domain protein [Pirellula staleyi DSM 6068]|uniref:PfkB domain protein n=1 Tax=Pirellula staleyi (strain ATCC 27377 / DSM 6068 / ICPB 4128) TaxID=530564 RepID=D2R084_PIRSD|nr:PfkB family carbohydrate kinase [Pirellula staleyi]ADB18449.1 PfkB domain protein [Pirellula staleyi DSM 6068]
MPLLVVGSVAYDTISTPTETREMVIGGSAVHFSMAASFFAPVRLVGVVGEDWNEDHTSMLTARGIDMSGLEKKPGGKTFFWKGKYHSNMNDRDTLEVHLNVFGDFQPTLPDSFKRSDYVFLANGSPVTQMKVLEQVTSPKLVVADTMDLWIREQHDELLALLKRVDGLVLNDSEAKLLTGEENIVAAGKAVRQLGPKFVVVKKGEHGAMFFADHETYVLPAFPTADVVDPTGAGDSFAGGMMGYLAQEGKLDAETLKKAMAHGVLVASFNVEDFSLDRFRNLDKSEIDFRLTQYRKMLAF